MGIPAAMPQSHIDRFGASRCEGRRSECLPGGGARATGGPLRALAARALQGLCVAILAAGCAVAPTTTARVPVEVQVLDSLKRYEVVYLVQAGDQLEIFVYRQPDFSRKAVVRADGFITLPLIGEVRAAGKSPAELGKEISSRFSSRLRDPEVTVIVENPPEPVVYVLGDVGGPKALPMRQVKTAAQAIAQAGVVPRTADLFGVSIVRLAEDGKLEALSLKTGGYSQPEVYMALQALALRPNDLVVVPESYRAQLIRLFTDVNSLMMPYFQYRILQDLTH